MTEMFQNYLRSFQFDGVIPNRLGHNQYCIKTVGHEMIKANDRLKIARPTTHTSFLKRAYSSYPGERPSPRAVKRSNGDSETRPQ